MDAAQAASTKGENMFKTDRKDTICKWLFVLPLVVLFVLFFVYPLIYVFSLSFYEWKGYTAKRFVGFENFLTLFDNSRFWTALGNNLAWVAALGLGQIFLAAVVAFVLARKPKGWRFLRSVYFLPKVISTVAISMLWQTIYNAEYGALNSILSIFTGTQWTHNWLGSYETALASVIVPNMLYIGYFMVIILAGVLNISESYYEAARIDGANVLQQDLYITLPLSKGTLVTASTLAMAYGMRQFEATYLMTGGGPGHATTVLGIQMYQRIGQSKLGMAAAIGVILVITGFVIIRLIRRLLRSETYDIT